MGCLRCLVYLFAHVHLQHRGSSNTIRGRGRPLALRGPALPPLPVGAAADLAGLVMMNIILIVIIRIINTINGIDNLIDSTSNEL